MKRSASAITDQVVKTANKKRKTYASLQEAQEAFFHAIDKGDEEKVARFLKKNVVWKLHWTDLFYNVGIYNVLTHLLEDRKIDPTADDNIAIRTASWNGDAKIVACLLNDGRVDPTSRGNYAICMAAWHGHDEVVELLLKNKNIDPTADNHFAIRTAAQNGHVSIVATLLRDHRIDLKAIPNNLLSDEAKQVIEKARELNVGYDLGKKVYLIEQTLSENCGIPQDIFLRITQALPFSSTAYEVFKRRAPKIDQNIGQEVSSQQNDAGWEFIPYI